jgi:zinc transporter, ZIP family
MSTRIVLAIVAPLLLIVAIAAAFLAADPLRSLSGAAPPVEQLTVERHVLNDEGIALLVRAGGTKPVGIAQVQVDGAYWTFAQDSPGALGNLSSAWLRVPYPWVLGETHHVVLITRTGLAFEHTIDVAVPTPGTNNLGALGLVGLFVGIVPVALGMLFYPALRGRDTGGRLCPGTDHRTAGLFAGGHDHGGAGTRRRSGSGLERLRDGLAGGCPGFRGPDGRGPPQGR